MTMCWCIGWNVDGGVMEEVSKMFHSCEKTYFLQCKTIETGRELVNHVLLIFKHLTWLIKSLLLSIRRPNMIVMMRL